MRKTSSSRAGTPLVEFIIATCIFAVAGVIIIQLFMSANSTGRLSSDINTAAMKAQSAAELVKAYDGLDDGALTAWGFVKTASGEYSAYYDSDWRKTDSPSEYTVTLSAEADTSGKMITGSVSVKKSKPYPFLNKKRQELITLAIGEFMG